MNMRIAKTSLKQWGRSAFLLLSVAVFSLTPVTSAQAAFSGNIESLRSGHPWYDPSATCNLAANNAAPVPVEANSGSQDDNARVVIGIAKTLNLGKRGALIGLMTALVESGLRNYANDGSDGYGHTKLGEISQALPHDAVGSDHDSVGIMQQRAVDGNWGPVDPDDDLATNIKWLMTPAYAAEAFFAMPEGKKDRKALINVRNWDIIDPGAAAQAVQGSAFPNAYIKKKDKAQSLIDQFWDSTQPLALPVPLAGSGGGQPVRDGGGPAEASAPDTCNDTSQGTGNVSGLVATIFKFAKPDYTRSGSSGAMDMTPDYINALKKKGAYRGSCDGVDCGAFVTAVMRESGADPDYNPKNGNTTAQKNYLEANAGDGKKYKQVTDIKNLQTGDIAVRDGHTFMYVGKITGPKGEPFNGDSASASQCERAPMAGPTDTRSDYKWFRLNSLGG